MNQSFYKWVETAVRHLQCRTQMARIYNPEKEPRQIILKASLTSSNHRNTHCRIANPKLSEFGIANAQQEQYQTD